MEDRSEQFGLLLRVITHDLLSPLTAVKWYAELMAKDGVPKAKQSEYASGVRESAMLGISITRRVSVAGRLLSGAYEPEYEELDVGTCVGECFADLVPQFARHGATLSPAALPAGSEAKRDKEMLALLVWSLGKYALTTVAMGDTVLSHGTPNGSGSYSVSVRLEGLSDSADRAAAFKENRAGGKLDQGAVFTNLAHLSAATLGAELRALAEDGALTLEAVIPPSTQNTL